MKSRPSRVASVLSVVNEVDNEVMGTKSSIWSTIKLTLLDKESYRKLNHYWKSSVFGNYGVWDIDSIMASHDQLWL